MLPQAGARRLIRGDRQLPAGTQRCPCLRNEHLPVPEQRCRRSSRRRRPEEVLRRRRHEGARAPGPRRSVEQLRLGDPVAVFRPEPGHDQHATVAEQERRMIHARYLHRIRRGELPRRGVEDLRRRGRRDPRGRLGWWRDAPVTSTRPSARRVAAKSPERSRCRFPDRENRARTGSKRWVSASLGARGGTPLLSPPPTRRKAPARSGTTLVYAWWYALSASGGPAVNLSLAMSNRCEVLESVTWTVWEALPPITSALPSARVIARCPFRPTGASATRRTLNVPVPGVAVGSPGVAVGLRGVAVELPHAARKSASHVGALVDFIASGLRRARRNQSICTQPFTAAPRCNAANPARRPARRSTSRSAPPRAAALPAASAR